MGELCCGTERGWEQVAAGGAETLHHIAIQLLFICNVVRLCSLMQMNDTYFEGMPFSRQKTILRYALLAIHIIYCIAKHTAKCGILHINAGLNYLKRP